MCSQLVQTGWYKICGNQNGDGVSFDRVCLLQESLSSTYIMWNK